MNEPRKLDPHRLQLLRQGIQTAGLRGFAAMLGNLSPSTCRRAARGGALRPSTLIVLQQRIDAIDAELDKLSEAHS